MQRFCLEKLNHAINCYLSLARHVRLKTGFVNLKCCNSCKHAVTTCNKNSSSCKECVNPTGRSGDLHSGVDGKSSGFPSRSASATRVRGRSVPTPNSPLTYRVGVDLRPFALGSQAPAAPQAEQAQYFHMGTPPQSSSLPTLPREPPANQEGLDTNTVNLFRQMMQAQNEQIMAQASQLTDLVKNLALAGAQNAAQAASGSAPVTAEQAAAASSGNPSGPTPMDVGHWDSF